MNPVASRFARSALALILSLILSMPALAKEIKATLSSIASDDMTLLLKNDGGEHSFDLLVTSKVLINQMERRRSDVQAGDRCPSFLASMTSIGRQPWFIASATKFS